jgi:ribosomal protein S7
MPRRYRPLKREVSPDIKYGSEHVSMCINRVMQWGKKSVARSIVYDAFDLIEERTNRDPLQTFEQALKNATPLVEVKPRRRNVPDPGRGAAGPAHVAGSALVACLGTQPVGQEHG